MNHRIARAAGVVSICLAAVGAAGMAAAENSAATAPLTQPVKVNFAAATTGTAWFAYAGALRSAMLEGLPQGSTINVLSTPMAIANTKLLGANRADIAMSFPPVVVWARKGVGPFAQKIENIRGLVGGMDSYYQRITIQKKSKLTSMQEIKDKHLPVRIGTATPGSLNEYMAELILKAYGLSYADIEKYGGSVTRTSLASLRDLFQDDRIDMIIGITTAGHPNTAELATVPGQKFLGLDDHAVKYLEQYGFHPATMPANLFSGQTEPVKGVGFTTSLYSTTKMPPAEAYALTKAIMLNREKIKGSFKSMGDWTVQSSDDAVNLGAPLDPGAKMYFDQVAASK
ncbi:MAG: TAXI family TRAP transporter solute-binding subunit [Candidimonas sp.]|nr:MAG: TAXI family TRAP transporter solute-binding subunit [Candidimonas sp.]